MLGLGHVLACLLLGLGFGLAIKSKQSTLPHEECWWGAHFPYLGLDLIGG